MYFKYDVRFIMNITDVDDKIILRGRQQYLFQRFRDEHPRVGDALKETEEAFKFYARRNMPNLSDDVDPSSLEKTLQSSYGPVLRGEPLAKDGSPPGDKEAKLKMHARTLTSASKALTTTSSSDLTPQKFYASTEDVLLPYLDSLYGTSIPADDHTIFTTLTKRYEQRFNEDMAALNVIDPDLVTRVTEYGPQIVRYVEKIVQNGFAYATPDGSVYFDIAAFEAAGKPYARLEPWNRNDQALQADGEGALSKSTHKRSAADFALWKSSNPGEPSWPSPWGKGRPGWHIECSTMASDVLGKEVDIHSGGIDLAFPHHDNELAQSEAYWHAGEHQWVNYFMHMGHLSIQGSKMSKSLKNFTTIREALSRGDWTARSLRIVFLLGGWRDGIEITEDMVKAASGWEDKLTNFFLKAKGAERRQVSKQTTGAPAANGSDRSAASDDTLLAAQVAAEKEMRAALSDSFDTSRAMHILADLVTKYNTADKSSLTDETTMVIATWLTEIIRIFGLETGPSGRSLSAHKDSAASVGWAGIDIYEPAKPFVYAVSELRDEIRQRANAALKKRKDADGTGPSSQEPPAKETDKNADDADDALAPSTIATLAKKHVTSREQPLDVLPHAEILSTFQAELLSLSASPTATPHAYLTLCDTLRDVHLWQQKIYLEDSVQPNEPALVRPLDENLIVARAEAERRASEKEEARRKREEERERREREREERARVDPREMYRTGEYGEWDGDGVPVRDREGKELAKSQVKKLRKGWEAQRRLFEECKGGKGGDGGG